MAGVEIRSVRDIPAPVQQLWELTLDVEAWPRISPATMTSVVREDGGQLRVGSTARIRQPRQPERVWRVTRLDPPAAAIGESQAHVFVWETTVLGMRMEGVHELHPIPTGVRNELSVRLHGPGARLFRLLVGRSIAASLARENAGFAAAAAQAD